MAPVKLRVTFIQSKMWVATDCAVWLPSFIEDKGLKLNHFPGKSTSGSGKFLLLLMCFLHQKHKRWASLWRREQSVRYRGRHAPGHYDSLVKTRIFLIIQILSGRLGMYALSSCHNRGHSSKTIMPGNTQFCNQFYGKKTNKLTKKAPRTTIGNSLSSQLLFFS